MHSTPLRGSGARGATVRVCRCALLAALALALAAFESLVVLPVPVPGMKLGAANVVTVMTAFWLGPADAAIVLAVRIVLAAVVTGQLAALPFSIAGGACALAVTLAFARLASPERLRLCAMAAAVAHNVGQMAVAVALTGTPAVALYLPPLLIAGVIAGYLTGTLAAQVLERLSRLPAAPDGRMPAHSSARPGNRHPAAVAPPTLSATAGAACRKGPAADDASPTVGLEAGEAPQAMVYD